MKKKLLLGVLCLIIININFIGCVEQSEVTSFTGNFNDYPVDTDSDGLYDYLFVDVEVKITKADNYNLHGVLYADSEQIQEYENITYLEEGLHTISLKFDGGLIHGGLIDGPYELKNIIISNRDGYTPGYQIEIVTINVTKVVDFLNITGQDVSTPDDELIIGSENITRWFYNQTYTTADYKYSDFKPSSIIFLGFIDEDVIDENGNDLYDILNVTAQFNITEAGQYVVTANLYHLNDSDDQQLKSEEVAESRNDTYREIGIQNIELYFYGQVINTNKLDGPYFISGLKVHKSGTDINLNPINKWNILYWTDEYSYTQFEHGVEEIP